MTIQITTGIVISPITDLNNQNKSGGSPSSDEMLYENSDTMLYENGDVMIYE